MARTGHPSCANEFFWKPWVAGDPGLVAHSWPISGWFSQRTSMLRKNMMVKEKEWKRLAAKLMSQKFGNSSWKSSLSHVFFWSGSRRSFGTTCRQGGVTKPRSSCWSLEYRPVFQVKGKPEIVPSKAPLGMTGVMATVCGKRFHGVQPRKRLISKRFVEGDSKKHIIINCFWRFLASSQSF